MQGIFPFVRADAVAGLGAAGLNLIVASVLVTLSLMLCAVVSLLAGLPALVRRPVRASHRSEETKVRHTFVRSMRGHAQGESVVPWRGYVLWVGGTLLVLFFAVDVLMPPPAASRYFSAPAKMPTIRIHSEVKGPEKVIIDTSGFVRPELRNRASRSV